ncbi:MAG: hypothetical protein ACJ75B_08740 [Flavisolibacter sp.]
MQARGGIFFLHLRVIFYACLFLCTGCASLRRSSKYGFSEGYYKSRIFHKKLKKVYVVPEDDSIKVYSAKGLNKPVIDTVHSLKISFPSHQKPASFEEYSFRKNSLDIDVISILFKYRPSINQFPNQFTGSVLNGAIYVGYRTDLFKLIYTETPLKRYQRDILHYGFSFGAFTGLGASRIDPYVTLNRVVIEYDGLVNPTGLAAIMELDRLSFGLLAGVDHLLDLNRHAWIYQGKLWIGLSIGLNLN